MEFETDDFDLYQLMKDLNESDKKKAFFNYKLMSIFYNDLSNKLDEINNINESPLEVCDLPYYILNKKYNINTIIEKEENKYIAIIPGIDLASQGDSRIDAYENLMEALELYFDGENEEFIKEKLLMMEVS